MFRQSHGFAMLLTLTSSDIVGYHKIRDPGLADTGAALYIAYLRVFS
jgi:hypothetical protein